MKLTKSTIDRLTPPESGQVIHRDDTLKGFGVRCTPGAMAFIVEKRVEGRNRRITLGKVGELTAEQARKEAQKLLGQIAQGRDPVAEKKEEELQAKTLGEVFQDYLTARKELKPKTISHYSRVLDLHFSDWMKKPMTAITKDMVERRHAKIGTEHGQPYANLGMRVVRALFNFAAGRYENGKGQSLIQENPVRRLSQTRAWYTEERRRTLIKSNELAPWYRAVMALENATLRDFLLLTLFTGLRREEAARLRWANVDLKGRTLTVPDTKNGEPHTLPLSGFLLELLERRKEGAGRDAVFVFPGGGEAGHIVEPRAQMRKVTEQTGIPFTVHDLRRTFLTMAESLDLSAYVIKRLANHRIAGADVTAGYIVSDVERLREPMERISSAFLRWMEVAPMAEVIPMPRRAR